MFTPPTRNCYFFYKVSRVSAIWHTFFLGFRCRKTSENAKYICNFSKKVAISFERGDIDVHTSHAKPSLSFHFLTCITFWTPFFLLKNRKNHRPHTLVPAWKPCKTHYTSLTFQKKYDFRSSVVTSMCAPPTRNHYFFMGFWCAICEIYTFSYDFRVLLAKSLLFHRILMCY